MRDRRRCKTSISTFEPLLLLSAGGLDELSGATSGNDFLVALNPGQSLNGLDGHDVLIGLTGDNHLNGGNGNDVLFAIRGDNELDGGDGVDLAVLWRIARSDAQVTKTGDGILRVITDDQSIELRDIERIRFSDDEYTVQDLLDDVAVEYRSIDGTNNNRCRSRLGSTHERLIRLSDTEYADGLSQPAGDARPSARTISNELSAQHTTDPNDRNLTDMTWLWGQFLDHDISISPGGEPVEEFDIDVPAGDALFDPGYTGDAEIEMNRTVYDPATGDTLESPREQTNEITAWIDGSNVYGSDAERAAALRSFSGGKLLLADNDLLIFNDAQLPNAADGVRPGTDLFLAGDVRANENAALASMHTLWVREHNRIASQLSAADVSLSDEQLYQEARRIVIAQLQVVSYNEFLPAVLGEGALPAYTGYNATVDPSIANEFSTAAYRFGHTMLSSDLLRLNNDGSVIDAGNLALRDAFFAPDEVVNYGIDSLLLGTTQQVANEIDTMVVDDVRNLLFGSPAAGGFDLASLNIQRGRDHGLADYNQVRRDLGIGEVTEFDQITSDVDLQRRLKETYGSVDEIDLWVGGLAEDHLAGSSVGVTFTTIIADQFIRLRDADRFWYQNTFSDDELEQLESTTLADVIERNTDILGLQDNVFFLS